MLRSIAVRCLFLLAASAALLHAQSLSLVTPAASAGAEITISGSGFASGERIALRVASRVLGSAIADGNGSFTADVLLPDGTRSGQQQLEAIGTAQHRADLFISVFAAWPMFARKMRAA